ncbi:MAG: hypothetical protein ABIR26_01760 [Ramlibacter sp.]
MHSPSPRNVARISRDHLLWAVLSLLVVAQIVAFWMLCSHQVRTAEARDATLRVQRVAVADCLRGRSAGSCLPNGVGSIGTASDSMGSFQLTGGVRPVAYHEPRLQKWTSQ